MEQVEKEFILELLDKINTWDITNEGEKAVVFYKEKVYTLLYTGGLFFINNRRYVRGNDIEVFKLLDRYFTW